MPKAENDLLKAEGSELENSSFEPSAFSFKLKIGYDGKRACNNLTGLGNYSRSLVESLVQKFPENEYLLYTPKFSERVKALPIFKRATVKVCLPRVGQSKFMWRSFGVKRQLLKDGIDLFHGLSHEIPFGLKKTGIKSIVTIHDLIFLRRPQDYKAVDRAIYRLKSFSACRNADLIIAISEKTKQDIVDLYGINPKKIKVVYQSCDDVFKKKATDLRKCEVATLYGLPAHFMLSVGTIEPRKNLLLTIRAMAKTQTKLSLVVIGKAKAYAHKVNEEIAKLGLQNRVVFLKDIPFADLPIIYQLANLFIYPSFYEGFGIPIIEGLYSGVPVISATGSCLEEAGGPDSLYVNPTDVDGLAAAIDKILSNETLQQTMRENGLVYVNRFDSKLLAQQLMGHYINILS